MRVLAVASAGALGGAELTLATFLRHRPASVAAQAVVVGDGPLAGLLASERVPAWCARSLSERPTPAQAVRFARALDRVLSAARPDVVWAVGQKAAMLAAPTARLRGVTVVWHKVDFSRDAIVARPLAAAVDAVIGVSEAVTEPLGPLRRRVLGVVGPPLGIDRDVIAVPDPRRPVIGTLGRLVPYKGQDRIVQAAGLLCDEFPALRVLLAGGEDPAAPGFRADLLAAASRIGIGDRVELPGFVDPAQALGDMTVFVNATGVDEAGFGREGLSGAMIEAAAAGVPVVAIAGGGTAEGMIPGVTGTLLERADPCALAEAIARYLRDPAAARSAGAAGRAFAWDRFAPENASKRLFDLLAQVTHVPNRRRKDRVSGSLAT